MPKKMRHSKFRNTGILFELLTRQITADIITGTEESEAKKLLFKYFKETTEIGREWRLYGLLLQEKVKDLHHAERFLSVILEQRKKLNNNRLLKEKYSLIKEIKNLYPIEEFLKSNIKNYRALASIFKLFEDVTSCDSKFDVEEVFQARSCIVEHIAGKPKKTTESQELLSFYESQSEDIRLLTYKMLVEKMNKKYSSMDDNQKAVLREYINNVSNTNSLGSYLAKQIHSIKSELSTLSESIDSEVVKIKITEVVKQLDRVSPERKIKDNHVMVVLLSYELLKEVKNQCVNKK